MMYRLVAWLLVATLLTGCQSAYYAAAEKVGYAKRDILVDRVESARDSQQDAKKEITDALGEFRKVVSVDGGELEARYDALSSQLADSEGAANEVHERVRAVEDVAEALFKEWGEELGKYSDASLRTKSERQMRATRTRYDQLMTAMRRAEDKLEPALRPLRDQVLYLKHNLNAQAIAGLKGEVAQVDAQVTKLVAELDRAIAEADRFIRDLEKAEG